MTGFSIAFPGQPPAPGTAMARKPDFELPPANPGVVNLLEWSSNFLDVDDGSFDLAAYTGTLKKRGILPPGNLSDPAKRVFQSDTGELTLNDPEKWMTVITPKTEAVSWEGDAPKKLERFTVLSSTGHAAAVSAVDGKTLADSRRIVLLYVTEAINTDMMVSPDWTKLYKPGTLPVLLRSGELSAELAVAPGDWKLYALGLDGERLEELSVGFRDGKLSIRLDTARLKAGVTPFFELVRE